MSNKNNSEWLEGAKENFDEAIAGANYKLAGAIIQDVIDEGFAKEARAMDEELLEATEDNEEEEIL